jgi:L,D-peptidoglycan transpeptidase YkuD (ErfK/YbiS/YcfS/YnhG family)
MLGTLGLALAAAVSAVTFTKAVRLGAVAAPVPAPRPAAIAPATPVQPFPGTVPAGSRQVVSVVAPSVHSVTATLLRWQRDPDGIWQAVGAPVRVALGAAGLTTTPTDFAAQTPLGTWAMDLVVARDAGISRLPEHVLTPGDGWSSCLTCADYDHLSGTGELWDGRNGWAQVAIHIVTNPHHRPGDSSGIFLHVGGGAPSAGCVSASLATALAVAGWLDPAAAPRIVIALG